MNGRQLTDAQISSALRAHLPVRAQAGLRERILDSAERTSQQRALPSFLGALSEADPVVRRRSLLIAAALLVALALASVAAVGALRLMQRDPVKDLSLETPAEVQAFVLSSHDRMPQLPPVAITTLRSDATKDRIYVDRSGAVRLERYASYDATEPVTSMILSGTRFGRTVTVGPNTVWVENDDAIGEDPRVYILTTGLTGLAAAGGPGCEMTRDSSEAGNGTAATGWRYVGADSVAGRRTHHLVCAGNDVWIDEETRLILRVRHRDIDDAGSPIPGTIGTTEVTKLEFGEQPAALFAFAPPNGVAAMSGEAYAALCGPDLAAFLEGPPCAGTPRPAEVTPTPEPEPSPTLIVSPNPSDCAVPSRDPGEPTGPLAWTQASLQQDWPGPVRPEPVGGASALPMPPTYIDPSGDTGSTVLPCVDIRDVTAGIYDVSLVLVANRVPDVDPSNAWIAYGVVVDDGRDGVPDWRYGIDNSPRTAGDGQGHHRAWRTNLHTGRTESAPGSEELGWVGETFFSTRYPTRAPGADARFSFGDTFGVTGKGIVTKGVKVDVPLYAWASVIVNGRVVATDYAPDAGWLVPSPGAKPGGTYVRERDDRFPLRLSMNVPDGWTTYGPNLYDGSLDDGIGLEFMIIDKPVEWGCDASGNAIKAHIGPKVDDLVAFLAGQQMIKISENTDVTLDGYRGKYVEYTTSLRDDNCHDPAWPLTTHQNDNHEFTQAWILDVDGVRLVIDGFAPRASESVKAELRRIVESIDIGP
jgi:hypothetical protein